MTLVILGLLSVSCTNMHQPWPVDWVAILHVILLTLVFCMSRAEVFNHPLFSKWVEEGIAPAIPAMLSLYTALQADNWGIVFMTGRTENQRNITSENLRAVGYGEWTTLLLRYVHNSSTETRRILSWTSAHLNELSLRSSGKTLERDVIILFRAENIDRSTILRRIVYLVTIWFWCVCFWYIFQPYHLCRKIKLKIYNSSCVGPA